LCEEKAKSALRFYFDMMADDVEKPLKRTDVVGLVSDLRRAEA